ncbi:hypothetical protein Hanom_Chr07g00670411 [Helianthus anomalus]
MTLHVEATHFAPRVHELFRVAGVLRFYISRASLTTPLTSDPTLSPKLTAIRFALFQVFAYGIQIQPLVISSHQHLLILHNPKP